MQAQPLLATQARIRRFERSGGVDLSRVDAEDPIRVVVEAGTANHKKAVFAFRCEMCGRVERNDQEMTPACTGPSWTDDHPLEPMTAIEDPPARPILVR